jgi:hypothetical protein
MTSSDCRGCLMRLAGLSPRLEWLLEVLKDSITRRSDGAVNATFEFGVRWTKLLVASSSRKASRAANRWRAKFVATGTRYGERN